MTETQLIAVILEYLKLHHIPAWRNNTGAFVGEHKGKHRFHRYGFKGSSDILGIIPPNGRLLAIEVKIGKNKLTLDQLQFWQMIRDNGGLAFVAYKLEDVELALKSKIDLSDEEK
jgi:hypothetical protein